MLDFLIRDEVFPHFLAGMVLLSRIGDAGSTYLVTPTLALEMNVLARHGGWSFILLTLLACLLPYYHTGIGVAALTMSFLATGSNLSRSWFARALGEREYCAFLLGAARRGRRVVALASVLGSAACPAFVGVLLIWFSGPDEWGYWFGVGILGYGMALAFHGTYFVFRLFRDAIGRDLLA